ncbi:unnamed protein product [Tilletia laevis]|uniref:Uncharacterized protein n=3 Tax=Tilletia TaxID=13289 RepID=A0A8X7T169_9BASI|nr:hypothetical protein A4X06_0g385 [Tilletia controversa]CAD6923341.1 unnamed protein product [Tilletia controversa]CAD6937255.1 unnamed protein product [Tilletia laevis]
MLGTQLPSLASWTSRLHHARAPTPAAGTCSTSSSLPFQSSNRVAEAGSATGQAGPSSGIIPFQNYTGRSRDGDERQLPSISSILPPLRNSQIHSVRSLNLRSTPNTHHTALLSLATHSHSRHLPEGYNQSTKESKGKQAPNEEAHELETFSLLPHLQSVNDSQSRHPSRLPTRAHHFGSVAASSSAAENDVQQSNSYLSGPMSTTFSQAHTRGSTSGSATLPHLSQEPPIHSQLGLTGPQELLDLPYDGTSSFGNEYALQPLSAAFILPSSSVPSSTRSGPPSRTTGSPQLMGPPKRPATDPDSEIASGSPGYNELLSRRRTTGSRMKRKKGAAGQQSDGGQMRSLFGLATADMQRSASDAGPSKESEISSDEGDASADWSAAPQNSTYLQSEATAGPAFSSWSPIASFLDGRAARSAPVSTAPSPQGAGYLQQHSGGSASYPHLSSRGGPHPTALLSAERFSIAGSSSFASTSRGDIFGGPVLQEGPVATGPPVLGFRPSPSNHSHHHHQLLLQDQLQHQHRQQRQPPVPGPQPFFLGHGGLSATPWSAGASHGAVATVGDSLQQPSYQALGPWSAHGDISRRSHVSDVRSSVSEQHQQEDRSNESRLPK